MRENMTMCFDWIARTAIILSLFQGAALAQDASPGVVLRLAQDAERSHDTKVAVKLFRKAISSPETRLEATLSLARLYVQAGQSEDAQEILENYLKKIDPFQPEVRLELAQIRFRLGDSDAAVQEISKVEKLRPRDPRIFLHRGLIQFEQKKFREAAVSFNQYFKQEKQDDGSIEWILAQYTRGRSYYELADYSEAIAILKRLIEEYPSHFQAREYLTRSYLKNGNVTEAFREAKTLFRWEPHAIEIKDLMADIWSAKKEWKKAIPIYVSVLRGDPQKSETGLKLAAAYIEIHDFGSAENEYLRQLQREPSSKTSIEGLHALYVKWDRPEKLGKVLKDLFESDKRNTYAGSRYGRMLASLGEWSRVSEVFYEVVKGPNPEVDAFLFLANALYKQKEIKESARFLEEAEKKFPGDQRVSFNRGIVLEALGRDSEAIQAYSKVTPVAAFYSKAQANLGFLLKRAGKFQESQTVMKNVSLTQAKMIPNSVPSQEVSQEVVVRKGETLAGVSFRVFGTHRKWKKLAKFNSGIISDPNAILEGAVIKIPAPSTVTKNRVPASQQVESPNAAGVISPFYEMELPAL